MKEQLVIVDTLIQDVTIHIYPIDEDTEVDEDFIKKLGHDPDYCQWFFGIDVDIKHHSEDEITQILH